MDPDKGKTATELFGGGPEPKNTRDRLVFTALNLFYEHGFHAIGLDRVLAEVGVTKTTFYNHFQSKDDLTVAAIKLRDQWESQAFSKAVMDKAGYDPKAMLLSMFDVLDDWFNHPDYHGCLFIAAVSEFPSRHDPIHRAAASHFADFIGAVAKMAEAVGIKDTYAFAKEWVMLLEGTTIYRQITYDNTAAAGSKRIAEARLNDYLECSQVS